MNPAHRGLALSAATLLLLASCGGDSESRPPVIQVSAGANSGGPTGGSAASESMAGVSADSKMMAPYYSRTIFEVAGSLPALDGDAEAWIIRPREVTTDELDALAAVFGVEGEFVETTEGEGESWMYSWWQVGPNDGTSPSISVQNDYQGSWWYSAGYDTSSSLIAACEPAVVESDVVDEGGSTSEPVATIDAPPCEVPPMDPPAGVPSADEAEALFGELLVELGFDPDDIGYETYADDWSASVNGWVELGGKRSSLIVSASYGENASLTYASGFLFRPEKFASYPRIGTQAALERLQAQYDQWADGMPNPSSDVVSEPADVPEDVPTSDGDVSVSSDGSLGTLTLDPNTIVASEGTADVPVPESVPVEGSIAVETLPVDVLPLEPEEVVVTIVGVEEELQMVFGADGEAYLIPSYAFLAAEEGGYQERYYFMAVSEEFVQQSIEVYPASVGAVARGSVGWGSPEVAVDPIDTDLAAAQSVADGLVGLSESDASEVAEGKGLEVRVVERDGEFLPATADYRTDRVNLTIVDGTVTAATIG